MFGCRIRILNRVLDWALQQARARRVEEAQMNHETSKEHLVRGRIRHGILVWPQREVTAITIAWIGGSSDYIFRSQKSFTIVELC